MEIINATYGGRDCTDIVKSKVTGERLVIRSSNDLCGDPLVGQVKYLEINWKLDGTEYNEKVREGDLITLPKTFHNKLGIFYSNNNHQTIYPAIDKSLDTIRIAAEGKADIVTCVWNHITTNPFHEVISWNRSSSHLNQLLQILQCIYVGKTIGKYEYVSFLEHDVIYPIGYFDYPDFGGGILTNMNYGGVNKDGFQHRGQDDEPMHQMTMRVEDALEHFHDILGNALVTNSGMIESQKMIRTQWRCENEALHINHGSHFTSHFSIYKKYDQYPIHPYWGDIQKYLHLFSH
jgi:hypothetical protein